MNYLKTTLLFLMLMNAISSTAQDFVGYMQQGKIYYNRENYLSAFERFSQALDLAKSEIEQKDAEIWKNNSFTKLRKQHTDMAQSLSIQDTALKKANRIIETIYFYDNRLTLARSGKKFGYINKNGVLLIPFIYDEAGHFDQFSGFAKVMRNQVQFLIDTAGNEYPLAANLSAVNGNTVAIDLRNYNLREFPKQLFSCINLKVLLLSNNQLMKIPPDISKLKNLVFLDLSQNKIQFLPDEFGMLQNLKFLCLNNNQLGRLPDSFCQLQNLEELRITNNSLLSLPNGFGNLYRMVYLDLAENRLKEIPAGIGKLDKLHHVSFENNHLGKLPPEMGDLDKIAEIILSGNTISDIPADFNRLKNLKKLFISKNKLINIPPELKNLSGLKEFDLRGNRIPEDKKGMIKSWFPDCQIQI